MSSHHDDTAAAVPHKHPNYFFIFIILAVLTAAITTIELLASNGTINWSRSLLNTVYLSMSITKALLVALYYMHMKNDHYVYSLLFGMPVLFAIVFFILLLI